jgi:hypothetical protein
MTGGHVLALEHWAHFLENGETADAEVLPKRVLHEQQGHSDTDDHDHIGNEESSCEMKEKREKNRIKSSQGFVYLCTVRWPAP